MLCALWGTDVTAAISGDRDSVLACVCVFDVDFLMLTLGGSVLLSADYIDNVSEH